MGLAASQARLLFITSRQSDVSANMQRISQENIILARDEEDVSTKYNQMLSATKMEYVDGVDLSYNALMGAGGAESGATSVKPITNSSGQLVMSSSALSAYGLPARGGAGDITSYYPSAKSFVEKVAGSEVASEVDGIVSVSSSTGAGTSGGSTTLTDTDKKKLDQFKSQYGTYPSTEKYVSLEEMLKSMGTLSKSDLTNAGCEEWVANDISSRNNSFSYMFTNNTELKIADQGDHGGVPRDQAIKNLDAICNAYKTKLLSYFGYKSGSNSGLEQELDAYILQIKNELKNAKWGDKASGDLTQGTRTYAGADGTLKELVNAWSTSNGGSTGNDKMAVNLTHLIRRMTEIALQACGNDAKFKTYKGKDCNNGNSTYALTDDQKVTMTLVMNSKGYGITEYEEALLKYIDADKKDEAIKYLGATSSSSSGTTSTTVTNKSRAQYYVSLYESLKNGWVSDSEDSINSKLQSGEYNISSEYKKEVADTETRNKAEAYYKTELAKINRKEKILDNQLTKLQTEYSALTNDYNSVKSILDANIQKSFTYCQNG